MEKKTIPTSSFWPSNANPFGALTTDLGIVDLQRATCEISLKTKSKRKTSGAGILRKPKQHSIASTKLHCIRNSCNLEGTPPTFACPHLAFPGPCRSQNSATSSFDIPASVSAHTDRTHPSIWLCASAQKVN